MRLFLCFVLCAFTLSTGARAGDCDSPMDQTSLNQCADLAYRKSDTELNSLYKEVVLRLKDDSQAGKLLVAAQRAWISFRDAECAFSSAGNIGGSIHPLIYSGCLGRLTKTRIDDLKRFLKCEEGDLSCPVPAEK